MRQGVDYYPFTKKQLLKAGDPDYFDKTPEMNSFISFLLKHYGLSDHETNEIALQIINMINADSKPALIIQYLQSWMESPSFEEERRFLKPLPPEPFKIVGPDSNVTEKLTRTKVGRNDPCPCCSGKKYKKCCGK